MTDLELQEKLHSEIPMTRLMQLEVASISSEKLITKAPLLININDKGTAFGGSLSTLTIISSWSMAFLISKEFKIEESSIVIKNNQTKFIRPVTKDIICNTYMPTQSELSELKEKLNNKNSGSIKIYSQIIEDEKVCVEFEGTYVIKKM